MTSSLSTTAVTKATSLPLCQPCVRSLSKVSFLVTSEPKLRFRAKGLQSRRNRLTVVKARSNEVRFSQWFSLEDLVSNFRSFMDMLLEPLTVSLDGSTNVTPPTKSEVPMPKAKDAKPSNGPPSAAASASEEYVSQFITQVASLVKLVDSRDIVELELKQFDCELLIRKKEALPQPPSPAPHIMMPSASPPAVASPSLEPSPPAASPAPPSPAQGPAAATAAAAKPAKSSYPPLKCPMAGIFYRCPSPGEPPFVKVGDKVQNGQVLCIIEAMKLMNEIEADQSGTIVEVLVDDGKPVSVDMPLFVIEP